MAVIGHAEIVVRAITKNFEKDVRNAVQGINKNISMGAGRRMGDGFADGFKRSNAKSVFGQLADGLRNLVPEAEAARDRFQSLMRVGYVLQGALGLIAGAVSSVVVSIGPLIGSLLKAGPAAVALGNAFVTLRVTMAVAKKAFGDIFNAVSQATKQNGGYSKSLKEIREEWQQLQFDAESAAYSEEEAALNLEKAFENLRRMADLPPNSAARREAELELKKADLAFRRAKDRTQDLNEVLEDGYDAFAKSKETPGSNPFADLNSAQEAFAKRLIELQPALDRVELKMSEAFLQPLYDSVDVFEKDLLPIFEIRLPEIAGKAGANIDKIFDRAATPDNLAKIDKILLNMQPQIDIIGDIFANILDIVLSILEGSEGITTEFLTWIQTLTGDWSTSLNEMREDGSLKTFFDEAGEEAKKWGTIIGNIFDGFGNLITLTTGPGSAGEEMLKWFTEATGSFANMFSEDPDAGKQFFLDAMINARAVMSAIGAIIKEVLGLADNPNIATAFNTLKESAPDIGEMLTKMIDAAPSFATLITNIVGILNALTDEGQLEGFFDTLNAGAEKVLAAIESPGFQKIMDNLGPIIGTLSALGVMFDLAKFAFQVLAGYLIFTLAGADKIAGAFGKIGDKAKIVTTKPLPKGQMGPLTQAQTAQKGMLKGLGNFAKGAGIVGLVVFLVTKAVEFYDKFSDFKEMVDNTLADVGSALEELWGAFGELFDELFGGDGIGGAMAALDPIIKFLLEALIPMLGMTFQTIIDGVKLVVNIITNIVKYFMDVLNPIIRGLAMLFSDPLQGIVLIVVGILNIIFGFVDLVVNSIVDVLNFLIERFESTVRGIGNSPLGKMLKDLFGWDMANFKVDFRVGKIDLAGKMIQGVENYFKKRDNKATRESFGGDRTRADGSVKLARGGTVFPSRGGTLATIAEAGRPERVEPLDPDGLSKRDKAMIKLLAPGAGGINITVNPAPGMDEKELAAVVSRRLAFEIRRGAI